MKVYSVAIALLASTAGSTKAELAIPQLKGAIQATNDGTPTTLEVKGVFQADGAIPPELEAESALQVDGDGTSPSLNGAFNANKETNKVPAGTGTGLRGAVDPFPSFLEDVGEDMDDEEGCKGPGDRCKHKGIGPFCCSGQTCVGSDDDEYKWGGICKSCRADGKTCWSSFDGTNDECCHGNCVREGGYPNTFYCVK